MKIAMMLISVLGPTNACCAQSLNIDFGPPGQSVPLATYGAAASQAGTWNGAPGFLSDLGGIPTTVRLGIAATTTGFAVPGASANEQSLFGDALSGGSILGDANSLLSLSGFLPGVYQMYVYGWGGGIVNGPFGEYKVEGPGGASTTYRIDYPGSWKGIESTYFIHEFTISQTTDRLTVRLLGEGTDAVPRTTVCGGMQIVSIPTPASGMVLAGCVLSSFGNRRRTKWRGEEPLSRA